MRHDRRTTGMVHELELLAMTVWQNHIVHRDGDDPASKIGAALLDGHEAYRIGLRAMSTASHLEKLNGAQRKAVTYGEPVRAAGLQGRPAAR